MGSERTTSAVLPPLSQKLQNCVTLINRFKSKLEEERRLQRTFKTMYANEIKTKNSLEKVLRTCVEDVKN